MSEDILLLIVVVWPLLLALPMLRSALPWSRYLAIVPALMLTVFPLQISLELPWLLLGTGLTVDSKTRWILGMAVVVWLLAATITKSSRHASANDLGTTFFMLTLAGNLGVILASDLLGFFCYYVLMGYGFYGLLVHEGDTAARRAGRLYLIFLIIADLLLFEAMLLAADTIENLKFEVFRQNIATIPSSQFYIWMTLIGFAFKGGIWPVHMWLFMAYESAPKSTAILIGGVPVSMALLGALLWLPVGEHTIYFFGTVITIVGVAATLYATLRFVILSVEKSLLAWVIIAGPGLFLVALGIGLADPIIWSQYMYIVYPYISLLGVGLAALILTSTRLPGTHNPTVGTFWQLPSSGERAGPWRDSVQRWVKNKLVDAQSLFQDLWSRVLMQQQRILCWQKKWIVAVGWGITITTFVLLGLMLAWLAK